MFKQVAVVTLFLLSFIGQAQEVSLPADLRQHALTQYNSSLFNPTFSLDRNNPQSLSFWTRWQWQNIDADPTTLFLNYSRSLNENSVASIGFFQHNTGIYFNTGAALNYAYQIEFNRLIKLSFGANIFGFKQQLADTRFPITPILGIPQSIPTDDFILQVAPGFNLQVENFSLSLASENLFDYNFTDNAANTAASDKSFMGMASYDFPVKASDSTAYVRPSIYLRTIPEQANQIGLNVLFSTQKFWLQSGYNNFYGISVGAGGTFFNRFSLGALVELGTAASLNSKDPSFELVASYFLGKPEQRRPLVASGILEENKKEVVLTEAKLTNEQIQEELEKAQQLSSKDELKKMAPIDNQEGLDEDQLADKNTTKEAKKASRRLAADQKTLEKQQRKDEMAAVKNEKEVLVLLEEQKQQEQLRKTKEVAAVAQNQRIEQQRKLDSIKKANELKKATAQKETQAEASADNVKQVEPEVVTLKAGEKYEEVAKEEGLEPGYYLIANVFGTKKYFDAFMRDLINKGMRPKSFYRSANKYNYAYLERYDTIRAARQARDSKFNGEYSGKTWIFRVVGN